MLVWRTIKIFNKIGNVKNRQGQGPAQTPELCTSTWEKLRDLGNLANVSIRTMLTILYKDLKVSPYKHQKKLLLSASSVKKCKVLKCILAATLPKLVRDEKKIDV